MNHESPTVAQTTAIEVNNCIARKKYNEIPRRTLLVQKVTAIQDATLAICSPRQYKRPIASAFKKLISRMTGILCNLKLQSSNLVCAQGTIFCSNIDDIIETCRNFGRSNHSSLVYKNIEENSKTTVSNSNVDHNNLYMCSKCSIESKHLLKDVGHNTSNFLKSTSKQLNNDLEVRGLHSLLHPNSEQHDICNIEPFKNQKEVHEKLQVKSKCFKQFDSVYGAEDHHFVDLEYVRILFFKLLLAIK